jgi:hypothetical protein
MQEGNFLPKISANLEIKRTEIINPANKDDPKSPI